MTQAERCACECGPDFVFTSTSQLKIAKAVHKRQNIEQNKNDISQNMNETHDFGMLNKGDLALIDYKSFK